MPLMSIRTAGRASRKFIVGIRLCPPARNFASSPCSALSASACASEVTAIYLKGAGFMALAGKETAEETKNAGLTLSGETPRAKYETGLRASQKMRVVFGYLKIR